MLKPNQIWSLKVSGRPDLTKLKKRLLKKSGKHFQRNDFLSQELDKKFTGLLLLSGVFKSGRTAIAVSLERNKCHWNALAYAKARGAQFWSGLALSGGIWRVHSWCMEKDKVVETTQQQRLYFGVNMELTTALHVLFGKQTIKSDNV